MIQLNITQKKKTRIVVSFVLYISKKDKSPKIIRARGENENIVNMFSCSVQEKLFAKVALSKFILSISKVGATLLVNEMKAVALKEKYSTNK
jgi:hypothetical protein